MAAAAKKLDVTLQGKHLYATATGLRLGSRGTVLPAGDAYGCMRKGEARRLRKALRRAGRKDLSGAPRYA